MGRAHEGWAGGGMDRWLAADGAASVASKIDAIASDRDVWAKTAFILNYGENDGRSNTCRRRSPLKGRMASM